VAIATVPTVTDPRELALLKAVGLDRVSAEQRELALNIAQRYELDLLLKHLVMIDGRPYVTRDGLLHIAHRSGQLDGMETSEPVVVDDYWRSTCSVYRKDMSRPFTYTGRYPTKGGNAKFAPEMAVKVGEVMALRRAFDVAAPTAEERWDVDVALPTEAAPKPTLAERAAEKRAEIETPTESVKEEPPAPVGPYTQAKYDAELPGLTKRQFVEALAEHNVDPKYATSVRVEMFPDVKAELSDSERRLLLDALLADVIPEAQSAPLFTEGEWAPAETTTA
jgi:hypothetical protein